MRVLLIEDSPRLLLHQDRRGGADLRLGAPLGPERENRRRSKREYHRDENDERQQTFHSVPPCGAGRNKKVVKIFAGTAGVPCLKLCAAKSIYVSVYKIMGISSGYDKICNTGV